MGILLPILLLLVLLRIDSEKATPIPPSTGTQTTAPVQPSSAQRRITVLHNHVLREMELETYLVGVVLAEMPASFEMEALRAQALAARTYTLKHCMEDPRHGENVICTDHTCCQAYISPGEYQTKGGSLSSIRRIEQAVQDTSGLVLVYKGELILATYFSCAGGYTEDAAAVWGEDLPYLQAVPSPGEEFSAAYQDSKTFTTEQLMTALAVRLEGPLRSWFGSISYTEGGGVEFLEIGGVSYRGTTIRTLLGLRSTAFSLSFEEDRVTFHTRGYGHRVGLSQYGANAMASEGKTYCEILQHYYTGAQIVHYTAFEKEFTA